ncbi:pyridoxamine 5'-phosphate oxidase family protein [Microbacterium sp. P01]|uniref:pyridoxamine 5'-phosphate oxidase family protein n=1 Tax=Microbacterium sp. P01 TaxID=3366261 RepID=UPI00366CC13F
MTTIRDDREMDEPGAIVDENAYLTAHVEPARHAVEHLTEAQCWTMIEAESFGRLAVEGLDGAPDVFPLNYVVRDKAIYIKSAPGLKLMAITAHSSVALEIDGVDAGFQWSAVIRGSARRLAFDTEILQSGVQAMISSSPTTKYNYVCITPDSVSGRRFAEHTNLLRTSPEPAILTPPVSAHEPTRPYEDTVLQTPSVRSQAPIHIAHFPPS